ncbi:MAG TPA: TfoX/Sxy family protein [Anaerolineales bacterium]|nr:TfoX/Sxy family protein [Anaerolineales bacterium]
MAYNPDLAERIREVLAGRPALTEKKMFGGIAFMLNGNMACGVSGDELMVRVGPKGYEAALALPHVRVFDMTGKPMSGWVLVHSEGIANEADLRLWVEKGAAFAVSLPAK